MPQGVQVRFLSWALETPLEKTPTGFCFFRVRTASAAISAGGATYRQPPPQKACRKNPTAAHSGKTAPPISRDGADSPRCQRDEQRPVQPKSGMRRQKRIFRMLRSLRNPRDASRKEPLHPPYFALLSQYDRYSGQPVERSSGSSQSPNASGRNTRDIRLPSSATNARKIRPNENRDENAPDPAPRDRTPDGPAAGPSGPEISRTPGPLSAHGTTNGGRTPEVRPPSHDPDVLSPAGIRSNR